MLYWLILQTLQYLNQQYYCVQTKKERVVYSLVATLPYGPADVGVRVGPVTFWYVDVCIMISLA
jgi:hypothetical protein